MRPLFHTSWPYFEWITATAVSSSSIKVSGSIFDTVNTDGAHYGYVYRKADASSWTKKKQSGASFTNASLTSLDADTEYEFALYCDKNGTTYYGTSITCSTEAEPEPEPSGDEEES